jgi:ferritin
MNREELINYIKNNDPFFKQIDLSGRSEEELKKIKDMIETILEHERKIKKNKD